jgi:hypothetical protein
MAPNRIAATLLATTIAAAPAIGGAGPTSAAPSPQVNATLTIASALPAAARSALLGEADAIWRAAGVQLRLTETGATPLPPSALRILVVGDRTGGPGSRWVAGELLRTPDARATAIASIARAEAIVAAAGIGRTQLAPDRLVHERLGVVLGRAVAHEIGHYLLGTSAHSATGLMRASIAPREFADVRSSGFTVDDTSRRRVRERLGHRAPTRAQHE